MTDDRRLDTRRSTSPRDRPERGDRADIHAAFVTVIPRAPIIRKLLWISVCVATVPCLLPGSLAGEARTGPGPASRPERLTLMRRSVAQDQGAWVIDYQLRHTGPTGLILAPSDLGAVLEGWVSNSRVAGHAVPRLARVTVSGHSGGAATGDVIVSADESRRCRERVIVSAWADDGHLPDGEPAPLVSLAPGATAHLRLRLEHQHVLYGDYDPLLGIHEIELTVGPATLRDRVALDREHYLAQPGYAWPEPPEDRR